MAVEQRLNTALRRLVDRRREADVADKKAKSAKEKRDEQERLVLELMEELGLDNGSITPDLGEGYGKIQFVPNQTRFSKVFDERDFHAWAVAEGREEEFFKEGVRKAPLNQLIREVLDDEEGGQDFPPGVDYSEKRYITVTVKK